MYPHWGGDDSTAETGTMQLLCALGEPFAYFAVKS